MQKGRKGVFYSAGYRRRGKRMTEVGGVSKEGGNKAEEAWLNRLGGGIEACSGRGV